MSPVIFFYIPAPFWPARLPTTSAENWAGFGLGIYAWTVQTYLKLREAGVVCHLTSQFPDEGIILFHGNATRGATISPGPKRLLICLKAESPLYSQAQLHVVQNPHEASSGRHFMPHWPQPGLLPRLPERQDRLENIAFLGHRDNLAADLLTPHWQAQLQQRGLRWIPVVNTNPWNSAQSIDTRWNDYQQIDAIVAVRRFSLSCPGYRSKPATKLYNAWLAGVPAILGRELAYRAEGRVGVDYLEANSMDELLSCLDLLRQDVARRRHIVQQGRCQAAHYTPAAITQRWQQFLCEVAIPMYELWCNRPVWQRQIHQGKARLLSYCDRTQRRLARFNPFD
ncbi:glycosyltransferase family 1 protein [Leptolyngbya cf. ectocarpi LEGE 11479]|uniref:Glycosyltransferase family 1 protein n=1 Tax=Leptolyngbya cf. ectocarpi LEGE 11479 TaxID=1828722 RepID=A0A928ZTK8_LEPEC|nr:glycosyltransferase [Leptolyngbya ectocarpi]MBE9065999.1 glycosyltransferase family 1 protein [Leptolyngbya cf. ectocarpi LEGE 11479]